MQTRKQSLIEVCISIAIGFVLSLALQTFLGHAYGKPFTFAENLQWTGWFTILAIARGYALRRFFNWFHGKAK